MNKTVKREIERLCRAGVTTLCGEDDLLRAAELTLAINRLKKEKNAVIAVHVYQRPEVLAGVADFIGDSYALAKDCSATKADTVVFCGVRFMAETAKILNPEKTVILPSPGAGCTLAESIKARDVRALKAKYPGSPVVSYINTDAAIKAESHCIVTSANVLKIMSRLYKKHKRVIFVPDRLMGANIAAALGKKIGRDIILWNGSCAVHERFDADAVRYYRKSNPGLRVLAHAECAPGLARTADFLGGTSGMMQYIKENDAPSYLLVTECGLGELARMRFPNKKFVSLCRLCPYMKMTRLETICQALSKPKPGQLVSVPKGCAAGALQSLRQMFSLAG